jgi:nicotinamide-nucleotide amidase
VSPDLVAEVVARALRGRVTLATAESCTGGLVASLLTGIAGVSAVYKGGIVAYSNEAKRDLLGVDQRLLDTAGAVSEPVARVMARGARERLQAMLGVSTTGIAGPGGATATKPVGLVYVAVSTAAAEECREFRFDGDRAENTIAAAREALLLIRHVLCR